MKLLIILTFCLAIISCKRKNDLKDINEIGILAKGPATCYNYIKDGDEIDIDCGGSCKECIYETPSCAPPNNIISIGTTTLNIFPNYVNQSTNYVFEGNYTNGFKYNIELYNLTPSLVYAYNLTTNPTSSVGGGQARVYFQQSGMSGNNSQDFFINKGKLYISKLGNTYYATICNGEGYYIGNPTVVYPVSLKLSSN